RRGPARATAADRGGRMTTYYEGGGVTLYHADCLDVLPTLEPVDHIITDPPYSEHVHSKSRAGARKLRGGWQASAEASPSNISREVDFGFDALDAATREACALEFARLASRWTLVFSDVESSHLW